MNILKPTPMTINIMPNHTITATTKAPILNHPKPAISNNITPIIINTVEAFNNCLNFVLI